MQNLIAEYMEARAHRWRPITRNDVEVVLNRMASRLPRSYMTKPSVSQFVEAMLRTGAPRTRQLYKTLSIQFFQWVIENGRMTAPPNFLTELRDIRISDEDREPLRVLTRDEWRALCRVAHTQSSHGCALLKTMLLTCMRAGELVNIKPDHFNYDTLILRIPVGKGGRARQQTQVADLRDYWAGACSAVQAMRSRKCASCGHVYSPKAKINACICGHDVFLHVNPHPQSLSIKINRWAGLAGLRQPLHAHTIRRTGATWLHDAGVDLVAIQHLLGHRKLATTFEYVKHQSVNVGASLGVLVEANQNEKETTL